jgi:hypothetical protein
LGSDGAFRGVFRLVSVDGQPAPYYSPTGIGSVYSGDVALRPDGTFSLGIAGDTSVAQFTTGTFQSSAGEIHLSPSPEGPTTRPPRLLEIVSADTVALDVPAESGSIRLRFLRSRVWRPLETPAIYVLVDTTLREDYPYLNETTQVLFDSLVFLDDVFYRRHYSERFVEHLTSGDSVVRLSDWSTPGGYARDSLSVETLGLSLYYGGGGVFLDKLRIRDQTLERLTMVYYKRLLYEVYERRK